MIADIIIVAAGLLAGKVLFHKFPVLHKQDANASPLRISVIIPARNEAVNLPLLLADLEKQTAAIFEIICVDDGSVDNTPAAAQAYHARLISLPEKPQGWIGKSWACQNGANAAGGDLLLFLDADVRLSPSGISRLVRTYQTIGCAVSVLPYHKMVKAYEQFSLFANLIQFAANGLGLPPGSKNAGLYGPVILIGRSEYLQVGGHAAIKDSIIDDVALGEKLKAAHIPYALFLGDQQVSYRMYGGGIRDLLQGWTKNQATGALKTHWAVFLMVFLWITACTSVPIQLIIALLKADTLALLVFAAFYGLWVLELRRISRRLGDFAWPGILLYPLLLAAYLGIFLVSLVKKAFRLKVTWKGREIRLGK